MRKIYFLILVLGFSHWSRSQSTDQNYIKITEYGYGTANANPIFRIGTTQVKVVYFDGLGRPKQEVLAGSNASAGNIVTHIGYQVNLGQVKTYLPFSTAQESSGGGFVNIGVSNPLYVANAEQATLDFYNKPKYQNTTNPYSEVVLEASPLKRVLKQGAPGEDWKISSTTQNRNIDYSNKLNVTNQVKKFVAKESTFQDNTTGVIETTLEDQGFYLKNTLFWNGVKDENGKHSDEFKDTEGKLLLLRMRDYDASKSGLGSIGGIGIPATDMRANPFYEGEAFLLGTELFYTYYVYDNYGNLSYVLPPLAEGKTDNETLSKLCYQYKYDDRNRMVAKKLPGKDWEYLVYDRGDRLVATGPVNSPFGDQTTGWIFTKYDIYSRIVYTGFYTGLPATAVGRKQFEVELEQQTENYEVRGMRLELPIAGVNVKYSNRTFPKTAVQILNVNYYDNYSFESTLATLPSVNGLEVKSNVLGLATGNWNRVLTTTSEVLGESTYWLYNSKNKIVRTYFKNHLGGFTQTDTRVNFRGLPIYATTTHAVDQASVATGQKEIKETFTYNAAEQLVSHSHQIGNGEVVVLAKNNYDNLRALTSKEVGGKGGLFVVGAIVPPPLQKIDFKYNVRGWLTQINNVNRILEQHREEDPSLFSLKLDYNNFDQYRTESTDPSLVVENRPLYNGNIAKQLWRTANTNVIRSYNYEYDGLNRLKKGQYHFPGRVDPMASGYDESLTYDKNGNILTLQRNGPSVQNNVIEIDDLEYTYEGNQLQQVTDATNNADGFKKGSHTGKDYTYDVFGNLITDKNKGITHIKYNHLNLPTEIVMIGGKINYLYNSVGIKLQKKVSPTAGVATTTDYLGAFQYENKVLQYFPTAEGYYNALTNKYVFQYRDHLGNTRLSYSDTNGDGLITPDEILGENNYYPFGLQHQGDRALAQTANKAAEKYKYNGKELQDELSLNLYDYGARNYDATLGRWLNHDPLSEVTLDPYGYTYNNPINLIDPTGMAASPIYDEEANFLGTDDEGLQGKAIVMNKDNFKQGMSHDDALSKNLGTKGLKGDGALNKLVDHYNSLNTRPDWNGTISRSDGIDWAKLHPNTLPSNITPDNSLYLDASKLNYGNLSVNNIPLKEGQRGNVNLFDYVDWFSSSSKATTYALGNTQMKLLNSKTGTVKLFYDDYDWDYHNFPASRRNVGMLPESKRDMLIYVERARTGINDSHGFRVFIYGIGKIKTE